MSKIEGVLIRDKSSYGAQVKIEITLPEGGILHLFAYPTDPTFEDRCRQMSPNERKSVIAQFEKQIDGYGVGECPTEFRTLLKMLKEVENKL